MEIQALQQTVQQLTAEIGGLLTKLNITNLVSQDLAEKLAAAEKRIAELTAETP